MHTHQLDDEMENDAAQWRNENRRLQANAERRRIQANTKIKWTKLFVNKRTGLTNDACSHIGLAVDNALAERKPCEAPEDARYVGWHDPQGHLFFVVVWSYLKANVDDEEASELAMDIAAERGFTWCVRPPDYVL